MVSDAGTMFTECTAGTGIAQVAAVVVRDLLENGSLIQLFADWSDETYAYHPSRHHPAAKVRAFLDFVLDAVH
jgi:DNA-binding transcriptional LysR family regulator